jgi:GT2 family glycosyltransferase
LHALEEQTYPNELIEILIINNDPEAEPPSSFFIPENAKLLQEIKPGSYAARNRGLAEATGDLMGFRDCDCVAEPDWIANAVIVSGGQEGAEYRITGPVNLFRQERGSWLVWKFESVAAFNQRHNVNKGVSVTANLFVSRSVFERVGVFDATLFSGGDIAWNKLASGKGVPLVYSEGVVVKHPARASMVEILNKSRRVAGGGYVRAKAEGRVVPYVLRHMVPPVKYAKVLVDDGRPIVSVLFASAVFWGVKLLMLFEIARLGMGGRPARQ